MPSIRKEVNENQIERIIDRLDISLKKGIRIINQEFPTDIVEVIPKPVYDPTPEESHDPRFAHHLWIKSQEMIEQLELPEDSLGKSAVIFYVDRLAQSNVDDDVIDYTAIHELLHAHFREEEQTAEKKKLEKFIHEETLRIMEKYGIAKAKQFMRRHRKLWRGNADDIRSG